MTMSVHIVTVNYDYEGAAVLGAATTLEDAKILAEGHLPDGWEAWVSDWEHVTATPFRPEQDYWALNNGSDWIAVQEYPVLGE
jgi:hypothetical protein